MEAVKYNVHSLYYADKSFCRDKEIVLEAVKQNGDCLLAYADKSFYGDKEIIIEAIRHNPLF